MARPSRPNPQSLSLGAYATVVDERLAALDSDRFVTRLWRKDPALWTQDAKGQAVVRDGLGWLRVVQQMRERLPDLEGFAAEVRQAGLRRVVHMGMGGSSLAPLVFARAFPHAPGGLPLTVLDTTDPATILRIEREAPLERTLFIVASKSGTTAEPRAFEDYFYEKLRALRGGQAGEHLVAITDPGTPLASQAAERKYRRVFLNFPDIGGRYSALTYFGLVPAALAGVDVGGLLQQAARMGEACGRDGPAGDNPGVALGAVMGELARAGRDKVTVLVPEALRTMGMWLEQLLAESTGKDGTGLLPVAGEAVGDPSVYGQDRLFARLRPATGDDADLERGVEALRAAGHPVVTISTDEPLGLGQEFFRWEVATATAGSILRINAFDQPNVQESKDNTNRLLDVVRSQGRLPAEAPALVEEQIAVYGDPVERTVAATLARFLAQARPGDYIALMAYLTEEPNVELGLEHVRLRLRDATRLATTLGYGPRFLHSTGQYHKGGPNTGLFIQITADDAVDAAIPGAPYTFGVFKRAQALGDLAALRAHGRRIVRLHLRGDVTAGLRQIDVAVEAALAQHRR
jgi:transaldolase/glucose-6-phosphate isomerase